MINLLAAVLICLPLTGPYRITQPGEYDFRCGGSITAPSTSALVVESDDVTVYGLKVDGAYECVESHQRSRVRLVGGSLAHCQKIAVRLSGGGTDNSVEGMDIRDSGNGVLAYTRAGESQDGLMVVGNTFTSMTGSVDGHAVGIQSARGVLIARNIIVGTANDAIAVYWNNGDSEQSGVRVTGNAITGVAPGMAGISFRATNGPGIRRFNNSVVGNTVIVAPAANPLYMTGAARTPDRLQWSVEAFDNYAPGQSVIRSTSSACPKVYVRDSGSFTGGCP